MRLHLRYSYLANNYTVPNYTRSQVKERIKLALLKFFTKDMEIYSQLYGKNATVNFTITNFFEENERWYVTFQEENEISREAIINPRNPMENPIVTALEENTVISYSGENSAVPSTSGHS